MTFDWQTGLITITNPNLIGTIYWRKKTNNVANNNLHYIDIDSEHIEVYSTIQSNPHETFTRYTTPIDGVLKIGDADSTSDYYAVVVYKKGNVEGQISSIAYTRFPQGLSGGYGYTTNSNKNMNIQLVRFFVDSSSDIRYEYYPLVPTLNSPLLSDFPQTFPYFGEPQEIIINIMNFKQDCLPVLSSARQITRTILADKPVITYNSTNNTVELILGANCSGLTHNKDVYGSAANPILNNSTGAYIFYTTDGSMPEKNANMVYKQPFSVTSGMTVKAITVVCGTAYSLVETYVVP